MKLSEKERNILACAQFQANASASKIRKETGYREHTIRHSLKRMVERGLIKSYPLINVYALGYNEIDLLFSLSAEKRSSKAAIVEALNRSPQVASIAELGGDLEYAVGLCARNINEVTALIDGLSKQFGGLFFEKHVAINSSRTLFPRKYLGSNPKSKALSYGPESQVKDIDQTDHVILKALSNNSYASHHELAKQLKLPNSTLEYRIRRLEEKKIIAGWGYRVITATAGLQSFKILAFAKGNSSALKDQLLAFCDKHRSVVSLAACIGNWDYEIKVEVEESSQLRLITDDLHRCVGQSLNNLKVLTVLGESKYSSYPFT